MFRQTLPQESSYPSLYVPVPRKDEMSEGHLEDYLDHFCAPLVGKVSYEERVKMRAELRSQIESIVAAYVELGSTREQAIALALQQFSHVPSVAPPVLATQEVEVVSAPPKKRRNLALKCFGAATILTMITAFSVGDTRGAEWIIIFPVAAFLPFLAGLTVGYRQPDRSLRSMLKALASLALPTLIVSSIAMSDSSMRSPFAAGLVLTATYLADAALFGGIGVKLGKWMQTTRFWDRIDPPHPARLENGPYRMP